MTNPMIKITYRECGVVVIALVCEKDMNELLQSFGNIRD